MSSDSPVLAVEALHKTFHIGFMRKRVEAVRGIDFEVRPGEFFGLLGPNGAGKTTTIKMVLRLIFPTKGHIRLFGRTSHDAEGMRRVGYMPENPYVYQYLRPLEFLDLCGRLMGMSRRDRLQRSEEMIDKVGLTGAIDRPIGKFSKGMTQRIGLAQALLHDPELLILDEPMSGLDPIGRKEIRDLLLEQHARGKTLLFTSHILTDVETLCDRVAIMDRGKIGAAGTLPELLGAEGGRSEVELEDVSAELHARLAEMGASARPLESAGEATGREPGPDGEADAGAGGGRGRVVVIVERAETLPEVIRAALDGGARVVAVVPHRETLEALFVRQTAGQAPPS